MGSSIIFFDYEYEQARHAGWQAVARCAAERGRKAGGRGLWALSDIALVWLPERCGKGRGR